MTSNHKKPIEYDKKDKKEESEMLVHIFSLKNSGDTSQVFESIKQKSYFSSPFPFPAA